MVLDYRMNNNPVRPFLIKLLNWEYWPFYAYYIPLAPYFTWLSIKARHPGYFTAANPGIFTGGFGFESKYETIIKIPAPYRPKTVLIEPHTSFEQVEALRTAADITFPLILKPDLGYRGFMVQKIETSEQLQATLQRFPFRFLMQEYVKTEQEFGVFYCRMPNEAKGKVTSLTLKTFLGVTGDGQSTLGALIAKDQRALLQLDRLKGTVNLEQIPPEGERVPLGVIGNHSKGTQFINGNHLIDEQLIHTFDRIAKQLDGIYYGRFDIKCDSLEQLRRGESMKILEINGVCSEPTHIYDQEKGTYFSALRDIARHWSILQKIAAQNHKSGTPYFSVLGMLRIMWNARKYFKTIEKYTAE